MNRNAKPLPRTGRRAAVPPRGRTSPNTRTTRTGTTNAPQAKRSGVQRVAASLRKRAQQQQEQALPTRAQRLRSMGFAVLFPTLLIVAVIVTAALATVLLAAAPLAWLPTVIGESWMVAVGAPAVAGGISIGMVPLLPSLLLFGVLAGRIYGVVCAKINTTELLVLLGSSVVVPLLVTGIAWFMLWDAAKVYALAPPPPLYTAVRALVLYGAALATGMGPRLWRALASRYGVPRFLVDAAVVAIRFLLTLVAAAAVVLVILFVVSWDRQATLLAAYPTLSTSGLVSISLLSIAYLPNALIGLVAILLGAEFHIGRASVSLFDTHLVPLPPLPISALIPGSSAPWAPGLLVLAVAAGVLVMWKNTSFQHVLAAGGWAAVFTALTTWFATGTVGYYGAAGPNIAVSTGLAAVWVGASGLAIATAYLTQDLVRRRAAAGAVEDVTPAEPAEPVEMVEPEATEEPAESAVPEEPEEPKIPEEPAESVVPEAEASAEPQPDEGITY